MTEIATLSPSVATLSSVAFAIALADSIFAMFAVLSFVVKTRLAVVSLAPRVSAVTVAAGVTLASVVTGVTGVASVVTGVGVMVFSSVCVSLDVLRQPAPETRIPKRARETTVVFRIE